MDRSIDWNWTICKLPLGKYRTRQNWGRRVKLGKEVVQRRLKNSAQHVSFFSPICDTIKKNEWKVMHVIFLVYLAELGILNATKTLWILLLPQIQVVEYNFFPTCYHLYSINWTYLYLCWNLRRVSTLTFMITLSLQFIFNSITKTLY